MKLFKGESRGIVSNYPTAPRGGKGRIWELDFLRGFTIILMCIDHFMFDLSDSGIGFSAVWKAQGGAAEAIARLAEMWWSHSHWIGRTRDVIQIIAWCVFFGLCGGSTIFSRDNLSRTMKTMLAAAVITLGTTLAAHLDIVSQYDIITFGVLHMLSFATLIVSAVYALSRLAKEKGDLVFFIASVILAGGAFLANYLIGQAAVQPNETLMFLHESFIMRNGKVVSEFYGVYSDYFALLPYLGYVFAGGAFVVLVYGSGKSLLPKADGKWNRPFRFVGRHTLLVVIVHQVFNMLLLAVLTGLFVDAGNFVVFS